MLYCLGSGPLVLPSNHLQKINYKLQSKSSELLDRDEEGNFKIGKVSVTSGKKAAAF